MITKPMLESWRLAKNQAITNINLEPDVVIAVQEMYIEAKSLRRENLKLLNQQELLDTVLQYVQLSARSHYITDELGELLTAIQDSCDELDIDLEL